MAVKEKQFDLLWPAGSEFAWRDILVNIKPRTLIIRRFAVIRTEPAPQEAVGMAVEKAIQVRFGRTSEKAVENIQIGRRYA